MPSSTQAWTRAAGERAGASVTRRSSTAALSSCLARNWARACVISSADAGAPLSACACTTAGPKQSGVTTQTRSEEHTSELQSLTNLVCRLLLEKKKKKNKPATKEARREYRIQPSAKQSNPF